MTRVAGFRLSLALLALFGVAASAAAQSGPRPGMADPFLDADAPRVPRALLRAAPPAKGNSSHAIVDDDLVECPAAGFGTIQAAVDSGARHVTICAGVYPENVAVAPGADVDLEGQGVGLTVIQGGGTAGPIVHAGAGSRVDISGLTIDGQSSMTGSTVYGILYEESDGSVRDAEVANVRNASGGAQGVGIGVRSDGARARVRIDRSVVSNYTRVGILGSGAGVDVDVSDNVVSGPVLPRAWAPNGIQVSRGATGRVDGNVIDNNPSPNPPGGGGSGIILLCPGRTHVKKNHVSEADLGISLAETADAKIEDNTIADSIFDGISLQFLGNVYGSDIGCGIGDSPTVGNDVRRNTVLDSAETGISFIDYHAYFGLAPALGDEMLSGNRVHDNRVAGGPYGIIVWTGVDNRIDKNAIGTNDTDAVDFSIGDSTAGTANEWKKNDCDTSSPDGLCK